DAGAAVRVRRVAGRRSSSGTSRAQRRAPGRVRSRAVGRRRRAHETVRGCARGWGCSRRAPGRCRSPKPPRWRMILLRVAVGPSAVGPSAAVGSGPYVSIVIPAYNEARRLPATLAGWRAFLGEQPYPWEILVVDDGSADATAD